MAGTRLYGACIAIVVVSLLLSTAAMAAIPESVQPAGVGTDKSAEKDNISTPLRQYGIGKLTSNTACSPDGTKFLTGSGDGRARLWDITTGAVLRVFTGHTREVLCVAFSPDGTKVLTGSYDYTAKLWDAATGTELRTFAGHTEGILSVAFSPDGTKVLTGSRDSTAMLWNADTGNNLRTFTGHTSMVTSVAFSPNGAAVLTSSFDKLAKLWNAETGALIRTFAGHTSAVFSAAFSPDGTRLLTGSNDYTARLWSVDSSTSLRTFTGHTSTVTSVAFSPDGTSVLSGSYDLTAKLWNTETGANTRTLTGHTSGVLSVAFLPDGTKIITGSYDNTVAVWNTASGANLSSFAGHTGHVNTVAFSPDGTKVLTGSDNVAKLWDRTTGSEIRTFSANSGALNSVAYSSDGTKVLTGSDDSKARLWNAGTGELLKTFTGHGGRIPSVAFSPDGTKVLTGSVDNTAKIWDAATGGVLRTFTTGSNMVFAVAYSPDGTMVLAGLNNNTAKLWNAGTGEVLLTFTGHTSAVCSVAFSPDGTKVLTGSSDNSAKLWNAATGALLRTFPGYGSDPDWSVAFSPDGASVLTGSGNRLAKMWDAATGTVLRTFQGHTDIVCAVAFSPDGTKVLTGSADGTAKLWPTTGGAVDVIVPYVLGETQADALEVFSNAGLIVSTTTQQCSNTIPAGSVISQNPEAFHQALVGDSVTLVVSNGGCPVTVPNVVGQTASATQTTLIDAGLHIEGITNACSNTVAVDSVISQNPAAGQEAAYGSGVALVLSNGPCPVTVPNVVGRPQGEAGGDLSGAGLHSGTITLQCSNTMASGLVISQNPAAGQQAPADSAVALVVSNGLCSVTVPNVVGKSQTAAGSALNDENLDVGTVTQQCSNTAAAGSVISQTPAAGQQALFGSSVALTLSTGTCPVTVPNVVGLTQALAGSTLGGVNLNTGTVTQQCSNSVAAGLVVSQTPGAGQQAPHGSSVALTVSTGPCLVTVPDVVGQTQAAAGSALGGANLNSGTVTQQCSNSVAAGSVISQTPAAGEQAAFGSSVTLAVSTGPCLVSVPNVVGQTQAAAGSTLNEANLNPGTVTRQCSNSVTAGLVISQTPAVGEQAPFGSAVALVISTGLCDATVPDVVLQSQSEAGVTLTGANLVTGTVTQQCSDTVTAGLVISQTPSAGQQATSGAAVALVLSTGACPVTVPDVTGQTETAASAALEGASLVTGTVTQQCSDVAAGFVIGQTPVAGQEVASGAAVSLSVSTGPCAAEGEIEGEVEGETVAPTETALRDKLTVAFDAVDGDGDGVVSYAEILAAMPNLTRDVFNAVDSDGDGWISRTEAGLDEGGGCAGCTGAKGAFTPDAIKKVFANLFLSGLSLVVLSLLSRNR